MAVLIKVLLLLKKLPKALEFQVLLLMFKLALLSFGAKAINR